MRGSRLELTWLIGTAIGLLVLGVTGCGVAAPGVSTPTALRVSAPAAVPTPTEDTAEPIELVIVYTSNARGVVESISTDT
jgi:hypothetical protein